MLDKLTKDISLDKEVLESLPTNNKKNINKKLEEVSTRYNTYIKLRDDVYNELLKRLKPYIEISFNDYSDVVKSIDELYKALTSTNNLSSPYEKLKLDKIVYSLTNDLESDLEVTNNLLLKVITIFNKVGIKLTSNDFNYTKYVNNYMKEFFNNINNLDSIELKKTFDEIYWKCPDLIIELELNIRYLYLKNKDKFSKYVNSLNKEMLSKFKRREESLIDDYSYLRSKLTSLEFNDKNNLIYKFVNNELKLDDYDDNKIEIILNNLFTIRNDDYIDIVIKLLNSLKEYKDYLKYEEIIIRFRELYKSEIEKNFLSTRFKKISKLESKLFKLNKKEINSNKKTKVSKYELDITNIIKEIRDIYLEIDQNMYKEVIKNNIKDNSTVFKAYLLTLQYYSFLKEFFNDDSKINEFSYFVLNPNNNIINNLTMLEEREIDTIIVDNYKLFNVNISKEALSKDNLDSLINDLEKIIINYRIKKLGIDVEELKNVKEIQLIKEKYEKNS